jgi:uncharacterized membrane protein YeaQ/YmgE (transglycosylase-associated protein family)
MAESTATSSGIFLDVVVGLAIVLMVVLSSGTETSTFLFSAILGLAIAALAGWGASTWEKASHSRRLWASLGSAALGVVLVIEWSTESLPVSTRSIEMILGVVAALVGLYAAWRSK